jgi:transposase InsO family protein
MDNQTEKKVKCLMTDNGIEYTNNKFKDFCEQHGIKRHFTVRKTPQQNGVAKRMNRYIAERA